MHRDAIVSVADSLGAHLPLRDALKILSQCLHETFAIDRLSLAMYDRNCDDFDIVLVELDTATKYGSGIRLPREGSRVGLAFETMQPKLGADLQSDKRFREDRFLAAEGMHTGLSLPLISGGNSIGTLNVDWRQKAQLSDRKLDTLAAVANAVARSPSIAALTLEPDEIASGHLSAKELVWLRPSLRRHAVTLTKYARSGANILLTGETGTGKGVLARALHSLSPRANRAFVKCDCSALSAPLIESDLFGHERGAFTGAVKQRAGRFEMATTGSIFLDEIGELDIALQSRLLSVIEDREIVRVGGSRVLKLDVRVIAGTNRNLQNEVAEKRFRNDLYHRLRVLEFHLPPLRDCPDDLPPLVKYFVSNISKRLRTSPPLIDDVTLLPFKAYHWPGNIRELVNVLERAILMNDARALRIGLDLLGDNLPDQRFHTSTLAEVETRHIRSVLKACNWKINGKGGAAEILGLHPNTLRTRMAKLGIRRPSA